MRHIHLGEVNYKALELFHTDDCFIPHTLLFLKKNSYSAHLLLQVLRSQTSVICI